MNNTGSSSLSPRIIPDLDPHFRPAILVNRSFRDRARKSSQALPVALALEQSDGSVSQFHTEIFPEDHPDASENFQYIERLAKFLLWSRGGFRLYFSGPETLGKNLAEYYRCTATGQFDADIMGSRIYAQPFELVISRELPPARTNTAPLGRRLDGCRIGFDLGASDRKVAAVIDGNCVFSEELVWDPVPQSDPQWHFNQILDALKLAASHLPRVDAIGGSSAGVYVNNQVKVASLFRGVPPDLFQTRVRNIFLQLQQAMGNVPFEVVNDGEVTALAGSMALNQNGVLGIAMGSSQAAGFVTPDGNITSWLNELAFAPIDYHPKSPADEWSGDRGCGVQYFSQQAVGRLIPRAGIDLETPLPLPEKLKRVQSLMEKGDDRTRKIYQTIGTYLGYTLPHYADFYEFDHLLVLGRVTTGIGGDLIMKQAKKVLHLEFPDLASRLAFHLPDEKEKRHGQAIAAASLPALSN
jgi:predicted NBD/HSP70 family sugar kinase